MAESFKRLYALAADRHLLERGNPEDPLHQIVYSITGKTSIKELTNREIYLVESEILSQEYAENSGNSRQKIRNQKAIPNMMSPAQQALAWRLMYQIESYDLKPCNKRIGQRLAGVVRKELDITASDTEPLKWVNLKNGIILIEALKRYAASAEKMYIRQQKSK
ncbi:MAG: regulatory protein GemA [Oscillospiraceae bacterium]|nr:regulatory protein GemA [Oscillospiraceae bacterium]